MWCQDPENVVADIAISSSDLTMTIAVPVKPKIAKQGYKKSKLKKLVRASDFVARRSERSNGEVMTC